MKWWLLKEAEGMASIKHGLQKDQEEISRVMISRVVYLSAGTYHKEFQSRPIALHPTIDR